MIKIDVKADINDARAGLEELGVEFGRIGRTILRALAAIGRKRVRANLSKYVRSRTGQLSGSVYGLVRSPTHAVVSSSGSHRAETLERGGVIKPKGRKYLTFRGDDGSWHRMRQVTIPAKRWFSRSIEGLEESPEFGRAIDKIIERVMKKAMKS